MYLIWHHFQLAGSLKLHQQITPQQLPFVGLSLHRQYGFQHVGTNVMTSLGPDHKGLEPRNTLAWL